MPVLSPDFAPTANFFQADLILRHFLRRTASPDAYVYLYDKLNRLGKQAANEMTQLSLIADKQVPVLQKRNFYGETINHIAFHPAYWQMMDMAVQSDMFRLKWEPQLRQRFAEERHLLGFTAGMLFAMTESGLYCPLCMTDGVARIIDQYASAIDQQRLMPHIYTHNTADFYTGAMFLTEKAGGSDVGANEVTAQHLWDDYYALNGEKWFCSNANAQLILALARTNPAIGGTKGLSIFLVEKQQPDGSTNPIDTIRLKDKLGVRAMASAECVFTNTLGKMIGKEGEGFKIMTDMINLSRLYNSVAAIAATRRALVEAYCFLQYRTTFGTNALNHALVRHKLAEICATYIADFYLTFHTICTLDHADMGNAPAQQLLSLITPMLKRQTAQNSVYVIRESIELMGGMGYIEDGIMPKLLRDAMVLPIWEGAGNIMLLDMLRATAKSSAMQMICEFIQDKLLLHGLQSINEQHLQAVVRLWRQMAQLPADQAETSSKILFERLTALYQIALLLHYSDEQSRQWIQPALYQLINRLNPQEIAPQTPPDRATITALMGWQ